MTHYPVPMLKAGSRGRHFASRLAVGALASTAWLGALAAGDMGVGSMGNATNRMIRATAEEIARQDAKNKDAAQRAGAQSNGQQGAAKEAAKAASSPARPAARDLPQSAPAFRQR